MASSRRIRVVVRALDEFVELIIRKIAFDIVANLKRAPSEGGTPVDTGWARANWIPRIGQPYSGTAGTRSQAEEGRINTGPQNAGVASLVAYRLERGKVFVSNGVPYIVKLNEGSSRQAPRGFVQAAVRRSVEVDLFGGLAGGG